MGVVLKSLLKWSSVCAAAIFFTSSLIFAQQPVLPGLADLKPQFSFSSTSVEPIIEYSLHHDLLAENDPIPLLRVYGDGRVKVHYPVYMKKAGDYEMTLSPSELRYLITLLSNKGMMSFNTAEVRNYKKQVNSQRQQAGIIQFDLSDSTETTITIRLDSYQRIKGAKEVSNMISSFSWKNLEHDARRYPQSTPIKNALSAEQHLRQIINHPSLIKIK